MKISTAQEGCLRLSANCFAQVLSLTRMHSPLQERKFGALYQECEIEETEVIRPISDPLAAQAGFLNLSGNLFDTAIMKTSVIDDEFRSRYLSNPEGSQCL